MDCPLHGTFTDRDSLRNEQYHHDANLATRIDIHRRFSTNPQGWYEWVFEQADLSTGADVLELGCGEGGMWRANAGRLPPAPHLTLTLTDLSLGMVATARRRLDPVIPALRWAIVDSQAIPFADDSFDVVIANHMLYHVPDIPRALAEVRRVLRPEGRFHAATNGARHMVELDRLVARLTSKAERNRVDQRFGLENGGEPLERIFEQVERVDYVDSLAVTEAEAVVRYILSTAARPHFTDERIEALQRAVDDEIATTGAFRIAKSTGLFTCFSAT